MPKTDAERIYTWLDAVADGAASMSQRRFDSIGEHGGSAAIVAGAPDRSGGIDLVAASLHPFTPLC